MAGVVGSMAALTRRAASTSARPPGRRAKAADRTRQHLRVPAIDVGSDLVRKAEGAGTAPAPDGATVSIAGQQALARLFGLTVDADASPADPAPTGLEWIGGVPFPATDTPPPPDDTAPDFDGGPREPEPAPVDPEHDHGPLLAEPVGAYAAGVLPVTRWRLTPNPSTAPGGQPGAASRPDRRGG